MQEFYLEMRSLRESLLDDFGEQTKDLKHEAIVDWVKKNNKFKSNGLNINSDGTIDIDGFYYIGKGNFPDYIDFNNCKGDFNIFDSRMTSLRGCPKEVKGYFDCSYNQLKTLEGSPKEVGDSFYCYDNKLTSLEGSPKEVGGFFDCHDNFLKSLKGVPRRIGGAFDFRNNKVNTLEYYPEFIGGNVLSYGNPCCKK